MTEKTLYDSSMEEIKHDNRAIVLIDEKNLFVLSIKNDKLKDKWSKDNYVTEKVRIPKNTEVRGIGGLGTVDKPFYFYTSDFYKITI